MSAPAKIDPACVRPQHTGDEVEECGLAGAVGTDDGADLAGLERQVDVVDGNQRPETANKAAAFK